MNSLTIAGIFFVYLLVLEWLFWRSPLKHVGELLSNKMGAWFYVFQPHYIIRVLTLCIILGLWSSNLALWPIFTGSRSWFYSFNLGVVLSVLSYFSLKVPHRIFWKKARQWYYEDRHSFVRSVLYLLVYPGFVEELLFRWFFTAILWTRCGWWAVVIVPMLNILWHLPAWELKGRKWQDKLVSVLPITTFAIALTAIAITTHNLIGPVIAHAFGDWCSLVLQRDSSQSAS